MCRNWRRCIGEGHHYKEATVKQARRKSADVSKTHGTKDSLKGKTDEQVEAMRKSYSNAAGIDVFSIEKRKTIGGKTNAYLVARTKLRNTSIKKRRPSDVQGSERIESRLERFNNKEELLKDYRIERNRLTKRLGAKSISPENKQETNESITAIDAERKKLREWLSDERTDIIKQQEKFIGTVL